MKKALFRCDAGPEIGIGHVMRCLTLANGLRESGWECTFLCSGDPLQSVPLLSKSGHQIISLAVNTLQEKMDLLVIDNYLVDINQERKLAPLFDRIMIIDDFSNRPHHCNFLLNQNYGFSPDDYQNQVPPDTQLFLGPEYALLRTQFAKLRSETLSRRNKSAGKVEDVLISIGGSDPNDLSSKILNDLAQKDYPLRYNVVTTSANSNLAALEKSVILAQQEGIQVSLHLDIDNMAALMAQCDLAIGAGGATSWERCVLGLPTLLFEVADNQRAVIDALVRQGAGVFIGRSNLYSSALITSTIESLLNKPEMVCSMSNAASELCDGQGTQRIVAALN